MGRSRPRKATPRSRRHSSVPSLRPRVALRRLSSDALAIPGAPDSKAVGEVVMEEEAVAAAGVESAAGPAIVVSGYSPAVATLADGTTAKGFICENAGLEGAEDVTRFGGWRAIRG